MRHSTYDCVWWTHESQKVKGKVIVSTVSEAQDEILDFDPSEPIHFETELDNPELQSHYFEPCGM